MKVEEIDWLATGDLKYLKALVIKKLASDILNRLK